VPSINEVRRLPWSAGQMYDLVADVGRYAEFLPWVIAARIKSDSETEMVADLVVGFAALREKFTSRVIKHRPDRITVVYLDGPMRELDNVWAFRALPDGGCEVEFSVKFSFRNVLFERLAGQYLDRAFKKMVTAFEKRAEQLYGSNNSSAISAA
jgi:coenzyme Q-binding protein COQ10